MAKIHKMQFLRSHLKCSQYSPDLLAGFTADDNRKGEIVDPISGPYSWHLSHLSLYELH